MFSGIACREASCLMFKQLEKNKLGMKIELNLNGKIEERVFIVHVDDAGFCASGVNCEINMQKIVSCYLKCMELQVVKFRKRRFTFIAGSGETIKFRMSR